MRRLLLVAFILFSAVAHHAQQTAAQPSIYILQSDAKLQRYDSTSMKLLSTLQLPKEAVEHPELLSIGASGQVMFAFPNDTLTPLSHLWQSDPLVSDSLKIGSFEEHPTGQGSRLITSSDPHLAFANPDDQRLYWFVDRETRRATQADIRRDANFTAYTTDHSGHDSQPVATFAYEKCECPTGTCSESCPHSVIWTPPAGVSDFFFVSRFVEGQTDSRTLRTDLFQHNANSWTSKQLPEPLEIILDAADHGDLTVTTSWDGACCGWSNETDETASITHGGNSTVFFDEFKRFHNSNYDVSFSISSAALSPNIVQLAYTVATTYRPQEEFRLSDSGRENPSERKQILHDVLDLPRAELIDLSNPTKILWSIPKSEIIGWLTTDKVLILSAGELFSVDARTSTKTSTRLKATRREQVFIR